MAGKEKSFSRRLKGRLIAAAVIAAAVILAFFLGAARGGQAREPEITADLLGQHLREVSDLVSVEYHYTSMGKFENTLDFYGWEVPFTTKSFIVSYDGVIRAGVDLSRAEVEVNGDTISVTLPAAEILSNEVEEGSLQVYDETHSIFNPISIEDYTGFTADQKNTIEQKAIGNGLLTAARQRAEETVRDFLTILPGAEDYTIEVTSRLAEDDPAETAPAEADTEAGA